MSITRTGDEGAESPSGSPPPEEKLLDELHQEFVPVLRGLLRQFKESTSGVSVAGLFVLRQVAAMDDATTKSIAQVTHITAAGASQIITQLIDGGLVERKRSEEDHRVFHLVATSEGRETLERNRALHSGVLRAIFSCLGQAERRELLRLFKRLRSHNPDLG